MFSYTLTFDYSALCIFFFYKSVNLFNFWSIIFYLLLSFPSMIQSKYEEFRFLILFLNYFRFVYSFHLRLRLCIKRNKMLILIIDSVTFFDFIFYFGSVNTIIACLILIILRQINFLHTSTNKAASLLFVFCTGS